MVKVIVFPARERHMGVCCGKQRHNEKDCQPSLHGSSLPTGSAYPNPAQIQPMNFSATSAHIILLPCLLTQQRHLIPRNRPSSTGIVRCYASRKGAGSGYFFLHHADEREKETSYRPGTKDTFRQSAAGINGKKRDYSDTTSSSPAGGSFTKKEMMTARTGMVITMPHPTRFAKPG